MITWLRLNLPPSCAAPAGEHHRDDWTAAGRPWSFAFYLDKDGSL